MTILEQHAVPTSTPQKAASSRLAFIDGLRGVAIVMVFLRHYYMEVYSYGTPRWFDVMGLGYLGVQLFLLLSGFCVAWAYVSANARPFRFGDFMFRRAARILPAYYVALALSLLLAHGMSTGEFWRQLVTHVTMTHNFFPDTVLALNGPFWSLALESQLYLCFPLLLFAFRRFGLIVALSLILSLQLAFRLSVVHLGTDYNEYTFVLPWGTPGRIWDFALGAAFAVVVGSARHLKLPKWVDVALPLATVISLVVAKMAKSRLGVTHPLTDVLWALAFGALLLAASRPGTWIHRVLSWRPLVFMGVISYSVYLTHTFVLGPITESLMTATGRSLSPVVLTPLAFALTLVPCAAFYYLVEAPSIRLFRREQLALHRLPRG